MNAKEAHNFVHRMNQVIGETIHHVGEDPLGHFLRLLEEAGYEITPIDKPSGQVSAHRPTQIAPSGTMQRAVDGMIQNSPTSGYQQTSGYRPGGVKDEDLGARAPVNGISKKVVL